VSYHGHYASMYLACYRYTAFEQRTLEINPATMENTVKEMGGQMIAKIVLMLFLLHC